MRIELPLWGIDTEEIVERVMSTDGVLKIVVKTRNEFSQLREWYHHHCQIVGEQNIIIADNLSSDMDALYLLRETSTSSVAFQFSGFHNHFHDQSKFPELYSAIRKSSQFYTVLDSDERLVWIEDAHWISDERIVDRIQSLAPFQILPGNLIWNRVGSRSRFKFSPDEEEARTIVSWGKPVLSSSCPVAAGHRCHNVQHPRELLRRGPGNHLFQQHLANLYPAERIRSNITKLVAHGVLKGEQEVEDILTMDFAAVAGRNEAARRFLWEIRSLSADLAEQANLGTELLAGAIEFIPGGSMMFHDDSQKLAFQSLTEKGVDLLFSTPESLSRVSSESVTAESLRASCAECIARNDQAELEELLLKGASEFPEMLDDYSDQYFQKELVRLLLAQERWDDAESTLKRMYGPWKPDWSYILFARQLERSGRVNEALENWKTFLQRKPEHAEAVAALERIMRVH